MKNDDLYDAFAKGYEYGCKHLKKSGKVRKVLAEDVAKWITVKPNGKGNKGKPCLIDESTGQVLGGLGGKFTGKKISEVKSEKRRLEEAKQARAERRAKRKNKTPEKLDFTNPAEIAKENILQNRNRSSAASVMQMKSIANNPDYDRLSGSNSFGDGAPVVAYGSIPENQLGRKTWAVMPDGTKYAVQYAVVEADAVLTSNNINGSTNNEYFSNDPSRIRAIAGNGRITGIAEAYRQGKAQDYADDLADDPSHGVSPNTLSKMKNPVLVRVMQPKDVSADIGDKSNIQSGMSLSAVEQAKNDANRVDFGKIKTNYNGDPTTETLRDFISKMPSSEQGGLMSARGMPTANAEKRFKDAVFAAAYQNDDLTQLHSEALDADSKNIINALEKSAPAMQALRGLPNGYDVRDIVANAASRAIAARANGQNLYDMVGQMDMFDDQSKNKAEGFLIKLFADNPRSPSKISEKLNKMADRLVKDSEADMFGTQMTPDDIIKHALAMDGARRPKMTQDALSYWQAEGGAYLEAVFNDKPIPKGFLQGLRKFRNSR